jgi:hypothetical protein
MLQSRHWAILGYCGLTGVAIFKGLINDVNELGVILAPVVAAFAYDKITSLRAAKKPA